MKIENNSLFVISNRPIIQVSNKLHNFDNMEHKVRSTFIPLSFQKGEKEIDSIENKEIDTK